MNREKEELDEKNTEDFFYFHDDPPCDLKQRNKCDAFTNTENEPWKSSGGDEWDRGKVLEVGVEYNHSSPQCGLVESGAGTSGSNESDDHRRERLMKSSGTPLPEMTGQDNWDGGAIGDAAAMNKLDSQGDDLPLPSFLFESHEVIEVIDNEYREPIKELMLQVMPDEIEI